MNRRTLLASAVLIASGCSSSHAGFTGEPDGGARTDGSKPTMKMPNAKAPDAAASAACHQSQLSSAPLPCMETWSKSQSTYKRTCKAAQGGYQATCASYDTIVYTDAATSVWCYYDQGTGNLIGTKSTHGTQTTCLWFDSAFVAPDTVACTAVSSGTCAGDSGAP